MPFSLSNEALQLALADGAILLGTSSSSDNTTPASNIDSLLKKRLQEYHYRLTSRDSENLSIRASSLDDTQLLTAKEALSVIQRVQAILEYEEQDEKEDGSSRPPAIGTRDLSQLRTLLSIVFKWAVNPLFMRVNVAFPTKTPTRTEGPKIIDLTLGLEDYHLLSDIVLSLLSLVFPAGPEGRISQTLITTSILNYHVSELLFAAITLGWLPESLSSSSMPVLHQARALVMRLLKLYVLLVGYILESSLRIRLTPAQAIMALGAILSSSGPIPPLHTRKTSTFLLTKQLLRPEGIRGLFEAMFSAEDADHNEIKLERLEQVATTLNTVPANTNADVSHS